MSTSNGTKSAYFFVAAMLASAALIPFLDLEPFFVAVVLLLFLICAIVFFNPLSGMLFLLLLRPMLDILSNETLFEFGPLSLNITSMIGIITPVFGAFLILENLDKIKKVPLIFQWLIFYFFVLLSFLFSVEPGTSAAEIIRLFSITSLFLMGFFLADTTKKLRLLVSTILISAAVPVGMAMFQFWRSTGLSVSFEDVSNRIFGTFAHPNLLAYYLVLVFGLLLFKLLRNKKNNPVLLWLALIGLVLFVLVQTYTRGAWIAIALVVFVVGIAQYKKLLFFSVAIFLLAYFLFTPIQDRLASSESSPESSSIQWRVGMWQDVFGYSQENLLTGKGPGTAETVTEQRRDKLFESRAVHNDYLKMALEYGLGGFVAYFALLASTIKRSWKTWKMTNKKSVSGTLVLAFLGIFCSLAIAGLFDNIIDTTALQWALWALAGSIFATFGKPQASK